MKNYSATATSIFFGTILGIVFVSCEKDIPAINNASEVRSTAVSSMAMTSQKNVNPWIPPDSSSTTKKTGGIIIIPDSTKTR